jgi:hypothetical protein
MTIVIAAERFSEEEGVVNVYSADSPGRSFLDLRQVAKNKLAQRSSLL